MNIAIPRGIIYHRVSDDVKWLFRSLLQRLDKQETVEEFEQAFAKYNGQQYCVAFPFARTAIYFALKSRNLPAGSEIIMPPITIKGILDVVLALELKPVFVDLHPETLCFSPDLLRKSITENTKVILITYLFGIVPDVEELIAISRAKNLMIIEDFSQCLNGKFKGKKVGGFGDVGIYSASSIKTLDTYGGGLLVTDNKETADVLRASKQTLARPMRGALIRKIVTDLIRNLATSRLIFSLTVFPLLKLLNIINSGALLKQTGDRQTNMIQSMPAEWFASFTSLQARAGLEFLNVIDQQDAERVRNVTRIKSSISTAALHFPAGVEGGENIYWQLIAYFSDPANVQERLQSKGVDTARSSLLQISNLEAYPFQGDTPAAERLYNTGYFVPSYPGLGTEDIARIIAALNGIDE